MKSLDASMVEFLTHGKEVHHAHIWIVPIYNGEAFIKSENRLNPTQKELSETAEKIKTALGTSN